MPSNNHSLLSPSSSQIWLECPPSAVLSSHFQDEESPYAIQGTQAHSLCEYKLKKALGLPADDPRPELDLLDQEMEQCSDDYAAFVTTIVAELKNKGIEPQVLIEQQMSLEPYIPDGFGYVDCMIIGDGCLYVVDFKYGTGVKVEAENNTQMMSYALAGTLMLGCLYDFDKVSMSIFQPRRENVSTWTISKDELMSWAENVLKPTAKLASEGCGEYKAGDHCRFCRAKNTCRKRAEYNLELARHEFKLPPVLSNDEVASILLRLDELSSWAEDIKAYALAEALKGKHFEGLKLVEGRSVRKYTNENEVAEAVKAAGFSPYEEKVLGITAMTSLLGRSRFEEVLGGLVYKAPGKPTLVAESDRRPALNLSNLDFTDMEEK